MTCFLLIFLVDLVGKSSSLESELISGSLNKSLILNSILFFLGLFLSSSLRLIFSANLFFFSSNFFFFSSFLPLKKLFKLLLSSIIR